MGVPHTPEGSEERDLLSPASPPSPPSPGPPVLRLLLLIEDPQGGHAATPADWEGVDRLQPELAVTLAD